MMKFIIDSGAIDLGAKITIAEAKDGVATVSLPSIGAGELVEIGRLYSDGSFDCWLDPAPWSILSELRSCANKFRIHCISPLA